MRKHVEVMRTLILPNGIARLLLFFHFIAAEYVCMSFYESLPLHLLADQGCACVYVTQVV